MRAATALAKLTTVPSRRGWGRDLTRGTQKCRSSSTQPPSSSPSTPTPPKRPEDPGKFLPDISLDDFLKADIRVAKIIHAEIVKGSNKLLKLELEVSNPPTASPVDGSTASSVVRRTVLSGIKSSYADPAKLIDKQILYLANLPPRKMGSFGVSQGMVLAASGNNDADGIFLTTIDPGAKPGFRVR